ncbi:MAG: Fic family protein [Calditrichaeota bacterium]|nr:MAG: Fic family protein [Calditrichota bacterium]
MTGKNFELEKVYPNTDKIEKLILQVDDLKKCLDSFRPFDKAQLENLEEAFDTEYTYDSNRIEGNTLTLQETHLVISKGMTIQGKPLKEHLEVINHKEALDFIKELVREETDFNESVLKQIHNLILRSIDRKNAGAYRNVQVQIVGSKHTPPQPFLLQQLMEDYFKFYEENKSSFHPVIFSAELHERLVTIHPFIDGNGRTSRLVMNLILMRNGFPIANISGEKSERLEYYNALEKANIGESKENFHRLVLKEVKKSLIRYLNNVSVSEDKTKGLYFFEKIDKFLDS